jgi:hypothetical protein
LAGSCAFLSPCSRSLADAQNALSGLDVFNLRFPMPDPLVAWLNRGARACVRACVRECGRARARTHLRARECVCVCSPVRERARAYAFHAHARGCVRARASVCGCPRLEGL